MKKLFTFLIILSIIVIPAFAQNNNQTANGENNRRAAVTINPNTFILAASNDGGGISMGLELALSSQFSAKVQGYFVALEPSSFYNFYYDTVKSDPPTLSYRFSLEGRWYPLEQAPIEGLFTYFGAQYQAIEGKLTREGYEYPSIEGDLDLAPATSPVYKEVTKNISEDTLGLFFGVGYKFIFGKNRRGFVIEPVVDYIYSIHFNKPDDYKEYLSNYQMLGMRGFRSTVFFGMAF
jgi:hypothetical protein